MKENIRKAKMEDFDQIIWLLDNEFSKSGFGFVNREQVKTEIYKGRVYVCEAVVGLRIGKKSLWNMIVAKSFQGRGIGKKLFNAFRPDKVRCKCDPVGHLSKKQKEEFEDPTPFYEKMGYVETGKAKSRNFWAGSTRDGKRVFVSEGEKEHIKIMEDPDDLLFKEVER